MKEYLNVDAWQQTALQSISKIGSTAVDYGFKLLLAFAILGVGWLVARFVQAVARRGLSRVGTDSLLERWGGSNPLRRAGLTKQPSEFLARLLFWLVMLMFLLLAVDAFALRAITATIDRMLMYLPRITGAAVIAFLGLIFGRAARDVVASGAWLGSSDNAARVAGIINAVIVLTALVLAVEQLGVDTQILVSVVTAGVATFGLAVGVAFALGAKPVVTHILAGHFLRQRFRAGQEVEIEGVRGAIDHIGTVDTVIRNPEGSVSIPNGTLLETKTGS